MAMKRPFSPLLLPFSSLLLLSGLACGGLSRMMDDMAPLSGPAYWVNATDTPLPTQTVFLGLTTPVYPPTPIPAEVTEPPIWTTVTATSEPPGEPPTATPFGFTATPYWVTTTPVYVTETPVPPWTTTPELPMIGFTTPIPANTPYYRVGSFYMNQDVYVDGPQGIVFRITNQTMSPNPHNPAESYLLVSVTVKNRSGVETAVAISDLFFIREVQTAVGMKRGMWLPKNDPLTTQGLPTYEEQLLTADGQPIRLAEGAEREYFLGFIIPNGRVNEMGLVTDWQRAVNGGVPVWFYLTDDPLAPFLEPCTPYVSGCQPLPPTPLVYDENGTYGGGGTAVAGGTPPPGIGVWPTNGSVTRGYGCDDFYTGVDGAGFGCPPDQPWFHNGIDIANGSGTPIYSPIDGEMVFASFNPLGPDCSSIPGSQPPHQGLGNYQRITDGLTLHYLGHLSGFVVTSGGVMTSQQVAAMGSTGCSSGSHLHWIVYDNGNLVDPAVWAGPGPPP